MYRKTFYRRNTSVFKTIMFLHFIYFYLYIGSKLYLLYCPHSMVISLGSYFCTELVVFVRLCLLNEATDSGYEPTSECVSVLVPQPTFGKMRAHIAYLHKIIPKDRFCISYAFRDVRCLPKPVHHFPPDLWA